MADPIKIIRALLSANSGVTSLLAQLPNSNWPVFATVLPEGFNPESNPAITVSIKGGGVHSEMPIQDASVQVTVWAGVNQFVLAQSVYNAVFECLNGIGQTLSFGDDGKLISCTQESVGQQMVDPDLGWAMNLSSFALKVMGGVTLTSAIEQNETVKQYVDDSIAAAIAGVATLPIAESDVTGLMTGLATLAAAIVSETNRAESVEGGIESDLSSEASTRAANDVTLQGHIDTEVSRAEAAEGVIVTSVTTEASTRAAADTTLQTNINAEASTRATADTTENTRALAAEALLAPKLTPAFSGLVTYEQDALGNNNPVGGSAATATVLIENVTPATGTVSQNPGSIQFKGANFNGGSSNLALIAEIVAQWGIGASTSANLIFSLLSPSSKNGFVVFRNNVPATSGQNQAPVQFAFEGYYWDGTASQQETWELFCQIGTGSNPTSRWSVLHGGSSGQAIFDLSNGSGLGTAYKVLVPTAAVDTNTTDAASCAFVLAQAAAATPLGNGVAAVGTATRFARADHVHPTDTTLLPKASPAFTGAISGPTAAFTKSVTSGINAMGGVSGAALAIDLSLGNVVTMTLGGNVTSSSFSNAVAAVGQEITFIIKQDATGDRTFVWPSAIVPALLGPAPTLAANSISVFKGVVDGSGNVNFATNGPIVVFRRRVTGITASDATHAAIFTPPVVGNYRITATLICAVVGAGGSTMSVQATGQNANSNGTVSNAIGNTNVVRAAGSHSVIHANDTTSSSGMGYQVTLSGTIGTAQYTAEVVIEWLGE